MLHVEQSKMTADLQTLIARAREISEAPAPKVVVLRRDTFDALLDVAESADNLCKATNPILDDDLVFIQRARIATHKHLTALTAALTAAIGESK